MKNVLKKIFTLYLMTCFMMACDKSQEETETSEPSMILVKSIKINANLPSLTSGHASYSNYDGTPTYMNISIIPENATQKKIKWSLSDTIAKIDSTGLLVGNYPGNFYVYAESMDGTNLIDSFYIRLRGINGLFHKNSFYETNLSTYQILSSDTALLTIHPETFLLTKVGSSNQCEWVGVGNYVQIYFKHNASQVFDEGNFNLHDIFINIDNRKEKINLLQGYTNYLSSIVELEGKYAYHIDYLFNYIDPSSYNDTIIIKGFYSGNVISDHNCGCLNCF